MVLQTIRFIIPGTHPGPGFLWLKEVLAQRFSASVELLCHPCEPAKYTEKQSENQEELLILNFSGNPIESQAPVLHSNLFQGGEGEWFPQIAAQMQQNKRTIRFEVYRQQGKQKQGRTACVRLIPHDYRQSVNLCFRFFQSLLIETIGELIEDRMQPMPALTIPEYTITKRIPFRIYLAGAQIKHQIRKRLLRKKWQIGIIDMPLEEVCFTKDPIVHIRWPVTNEEATFNADPFGIGEGPEMRILFESLIDGKGDLYSMSPGGDAQVLHKESHHLSYPYTLKAHGIWYCIPEQHHLNKVILYRYDFQKRQLQQEAVLLDNFSGVDPSLIYYENRWWLFCTESRDKGADHRLFIFHASDLKGPYTPHMQNPVKTDVCSARPAGHLFIHQGILYRPSQDSGTTYGGAIVINRITGLSPDIFREEEVNRIRPEQLGGAAAIAIHTISRLGSQTLIDAGFEKIKFI